MLTLGKIECKPLHAVGRHSYSTPWQVSLIRHGCHLATADQPHWPPGPEAWKAWTQHHLWSHSRWCQDWMLRECPLLLPSSQPLHTSTCTSCPPTVYQACKHGQKHADLVTGMHKTSRRSNDVSQSEGHIMHEHRGLHCCLTWCDRLQ